MSPEVKKPWHQSGLFWLWVTLLVLILDQWTKVLASQHLAQGEIIEIFSWFDLRLAHNFGAAFSFLSDAGGWQRWFFTIVAILISGAILYWLRSLPRSARFEGIAFALVLSGALGNVYDRIMLGYVIDFIDWHAAGYHWPAFNIADAAITLGVVMLLIESFTGKSQVAEHD